MTVIKIDSRTISQLLQPVVISEIDISLENIAYEEVKEYIRSSNH